MLNLSIYDESSEYGASISVREIDDAAIEEKVKELVLVFSEIRNELPRHGKGRLMADRDALICAKGIIVTLYEFGMICDDTYYSLLKSCELLTHKVITRIHKANQLRSRSHRINAHLLMLNVGGDRKI